MRPVLVFALVGAVLTLAVPASADIPEEEFYLGITGGGTLPVTGWDLGKVAHEGTLEPGNSPQIGLRFGYQFSWLLAVEGGAQYESLRLSPGSGGNDGLVYNADALFHILKGDFSPFAVAGLGAYQAFGGKLHNDVDWQFHLGVGVRGMLLDWMAGRVELRDAVTDGFSSGAFGGGNNLELTVGVDLFAFQARDSDKDGFADKEDRCPTVKGVASAGGCPDADGDGIADADDKCINQPGKAELNGCPDRDSDGIADADDRCPDTKGVASAFGCPDRDGDGLADAVDACPDAAGLASLKGCPDRDSDGIADNEDRCPGLKGVKSAQGCPDADADGVADADDVCPSEPGKPALKGCPDRDGDGLADRDDKCPDVRGLAELQGCLPAEVKRFTGTIQGINFEPGKAKLLANSYGTLDRAVEVLLKYPSMRIRIEGHTDSTGDAELNRKLSAERAAAVMQYLVGKSVGASRLEAQGYGPDKPIAPNKTATGRAQNRRVEFTLVEQ